MKKNVLLIGGRSKARALSQSLSDKGCCVTIINASDEDCRMLADSGNGMVVLGDGTKPYVLEDAEAFSADIAIALTSKDEDNLVICQLCKKRFGVKRTISLLSDPKKDGFLLFHGCGQSHMHNICCNRYHRTAGIYGRNDQCHPDFRG